MNLEERIIRLEREGRNWRRIAIGLAIAMGVSLSCSQGAVGPTSDSPDSGQANAATIDGIHETVRTHRLQIVNSQGQTVASFDAVGPGAWLSLSNLDNHGEILFHTIVNPECNISSRDSKIEISAGSLDLIRPDPNKRQLRDEVERKIREGVKLTDRESDAFEKMFLTVVSIGSRNSRGGIVDVYNPLGKIVATMQSDKTNEGLVSVSDVNGKSAANIGSSSGGGIVDVYNPFGKRVVSMQSSKTNTGMVSVSDVNGESRNFLTPTR